MKTNRNHALQATPVFTGHDTGPDYRRMKKDEHDCKRCLADYDYTIYGGS